MCFKKRKFVKELDEKYKESPGVISSGRWFPTKSIKLYNHSKYYVEVDVRDVKGTFLRSLSLGAFNANAGVEFDEGDHSTIQNAKVISNNMKKMTIGSYSYSITAYMNGKQIFENRVYKSCKYAVFHDRHYEERNINKPMRCVPSHLYIPDEKPEIIKKKKRWFFLFLF